jgi:anti-sigma regulatory factor (Ser/Thr protein kinase)
VARNPVASSGANGTEHIPISATSVAEARRAVDTLLADAQPSDEFAGSVRLVVCELVSNAVQHGDPSHPIS